MSELSSNALEVAESRYFMEGENWEDLCRRVSETVARNESSYEEYKDKFYNMIYNMEFLPAGRILRNSGRSRGSLFNCFNVPIGDSIEEIGQCIKDSLILWSDGGGVGVDISQLRPALAPIKGKGGKSSGAVSFLSAMDAVASTIESGGSRRAAALASISVSHPEVTNFIDAKVVDGRLPHFNISVAITEEFLGAVIEDKTWEFKFAQQNYGQVKARELWDHILSNMIEYAEPGILNWSNLVKNNSFYFAPIRGVNPCSEAVLDSYGSCDLGSVVLTKFVPSSNTNWQKLESTLRLAVRFLDDVIDINNYSIEKVRMAAQNSRRIGIGICGLAEYLFAKKARYGSEKSILEVERLMRFIRDIVYDESVNLSIEKGAFPAFNPIDYSKASFIRKLPAKLRMRIRENGIRNVTLLALAPTGSVSLLPEVVPGIEPLFSKAYRRKDRVSERIYIHNLYTEMLAKNEEIPDWYVDAYDLVPEDHFEIQVACQKYTDGGISKTIFLPENSTKDDLNKLLLEYINDLKGITVYRDKSRKDQILERMNKNEISKALKKEANIYSSMTEEDVSCAKGTCEI